MCFLGVETDVVAVAVHAYAGRFQRLTVYDSALDDVISPTANDQEKYIQTQRYTHSHDDTYRMHMQGHSSIAVATIAVCGMLEEQCCSSARCEIHRSSCELLSHPIDNEHL